MNTTTYLFVLFCAFLIAFVPFVSTCDDGCQTCGSDGVTCQTCNPQYYTTTRINGGVECHTQCAPGSHGTEGSTTNPKTCLPCGSNCNTCTSNTMCTQCQETYKLTNDGQCVKSDSTSPPMTDGTKPPSGDSTTPPNSEPTKRPGEGTLPTTMPPSNTPSNGPSGDGTKPPSNTPTNGPSGDGTKAPTHGPSGDGTKPPSGDGTKPPTTNAPSGDGTKPPTTPTNGPSGDGTKPPSNNPTNAPSGDGTKPPNTPTTAPSGDGTKPPTRSPSGDGTKPPSNTPSHGPSGDGTKAPTRAPSGDGTKPPSNTPSHGPSGDGTKPPSGISTKPPPRAEYHISLTQPITLPDGFVLSNFNYTFYIELFVVELRISADDIVVILHLKNKRSVDYELNTNITVHDTSSQSIDDTREKAVSIINSPTAQSFLTNNNITAGNVTSVANVQYVEVDQPTANPKGSASSLAIGSFTLLAALLLLL